MGSGIGGGGERRGGIRGGGVCDLRNCFQLKLILKYCPPLQIVKIKLNHDFMIISTQS